MYTALYRSQRPEVFSEILGQEHIVKILKYQIATDTVSHAYLFCGTRGTGKTTTARILAKAVNCLADPGEGEGRPCGHCASCEAIKNGTFMDVVEIDAASNNGVDNIRELRESVKYPPAVGRKKVYIIDEVHMLSPGAFNALLKTLEEPPENVMFILATTEPQKLPATILSRCMRLDFKRVPQNILAEGMRQICREKGIEITDGAVKLLATNADGSVRDGLSILDQVISAGDTYIDRDKVLEYIGTAGEDFFIELTELVAVHNVAEALVLLDGALADGKDVKQLMKDWTAHYRSLLVTKFIKNPEDMLNMASENIEKIRAQSHQISLEEINSAIIRLSKTINDARWSTQPRILLELAIVAIATDLIDEERVQPVRRAGYGYGLQQAAPTQQAGQPFQPQQSQSTTMQQPGQQAEPYHQPLQAAQYAAQGGQPVSQLAQQSASPQQPAGGMPPAAEVQTPENHGAAAYQAGSGMAGDTGSGAGTGAGIGAGTGDVGMQAPTMTRAQMDSLWHQIFEEGEGSASSFNLIRSGTVLGNVGEKEFLVLAKTGFAKRYAEKMQPDLERLMERHVGRHLKMVCKLETEEVHKSADSEMEALARMASETLGIHVEIE